MVDGFMLIYSEEIRNKIKASIDALSDTDKANFSSQLILLDDLDKLVKEQSTLKEAAG